MCAEKLGPRGLIRPRGVYLLIYLMACAALISSSVEWRSL